MKKRIITVLVAALIVSGLFVHKAQAKTYKNFVYSIKNDKVTITGYNGQVPAALEIPEKIAGLPVTRIADEAFSDRDTLVYVSMPSVKTVGAAAFEGCNGLRVVSMPSVTTVKEYAFFDTALVSADLARATKIGDFAFSGTFLRDIRLPKAKTIGECAFRDCTEAVTLSLPAAEQLGSEAFRDCSSVTYADLPEVVGIGNYTFDGCTSLASVHMPKAEIIGKSAFRNCKSLTSVVLPSVLKDLVNNPFVGCSKLGSITMPDAMFFMCEDNVVYTRDGKRVLFAAAASTITVNEGVESIANYAFTAAAHTVHISFLGDAPKCTAKAFGGEAGGEFMVHYSKNADGFTTPSWKGITAVPDVSDESVSPSAMPSDTSDTSDTEESLSAGDDLSDETGDSLWDSEGSAQATDATVAGIKNIDTILVFVLCVLGAAILLMIALNRSDT